MAKNNKKTTEEAAPTAAPSKRGNKKGPMLVAKTAKEIAALFGEDTPVLVSIKSIVDTDAALQKANRRAALGF